MSENPPKGDSGATSPEGLVELAFHFGSDKGPAPTTQSPRPDDVVTFWQEAGRVLWFAKDVDFDRCFRERFLRAHEAAVLGRLDCWLATPTGALALILLLDQFPRNSFRGTPRMYASDAQAVVAANLAIAAGYDRRIARELRPFIYLPFGHSENIADQERAVELVRQFDERLLPLVERHRDIIDRFGRFPHRNPILGRAMTVEEQAFLDQGGFAG